MKKISVCCLASFLALVMVSCSLIPSNAASQDDQNWINTAVAATLQAFELTRTAAISNIVLTPTASPEPPSSDVYIPSDATLPDRHDWVEYTNQTYSFSLLYPSDWNLTVINEADNMLSGHSLRFTPSSNPSISLYINFRALDEAIQISPTGMGAGELISRGNILFIGQPVERVALVGENKDLGVFYRGTERELVRGNMAFVLLLNCACSPLDSLTLSAEEEQIADGILTSVTLSNQ